jgi:hypothetical protein
MFHPYLHEFRIRSVLSPELAECFRKLPGAFLVRSIILILAPPHRVDTKMRLLAIVDLWTAALRYKAIL